MLLVKILVLVFCLAIFIEDIISRSVHWFLFPLLYGALLAVGYFSSSNLAAIFHQTFFNTLFLILQLVILTLYFSVRNRAFTNITKGLLGWGDILFLLSITVYFSLLNYVAFYILSLILVLLVWAGINMISKIRRKYVPLAGLQALLFVVFFVVEWFHPVFKVNNDNWIIDKIISL